MTKLELRAATAADIAGITAIYCAAVRGGTASFELEAPDEAEMERRWRTITDAGFPYLVACQSADEGRRGAVRGGDVLGYAYVSQYRPRPAYRYSVENSIYVAESAHRGGVGRALLRELIRASTAKGYRQMIAVIGDSGQAASIGLHRSLDFKFCGTIHSVGYKHGRWLDSVLMQLPLGAGDTAPPDTHSE